MEDPWARPPEGVWQHDHGERPPSPARSSIGFEQGVPVALDGRAPARCTSSSSSSTTSSAPTAGAASTWSRTGGSASRAARPTRRPGALALIDGPRGPRVDHPRARPQREKSRLERRYAELVYDGMWYSPLKEALDAFVDSTQRYVTGEVRLRLEPGRCYVVGRRSPHSLYDYGLATYDAADTLPPRRLRGLRAALGPRRRDVVRHAGPRVRHASIGVRRHRRLRSVHEHAVARPLRRRSRPRS